MTIVSPAPGADSKNAAGLDAAAPLVLTGRGGSGTRLFSQVFQQLGVFLGNRVNRTEDSVEWVETIYGVGIDKLRNGRTPDNAVAALRACAAAILAGEAPQAAPSDDAPESPGHWGWKLPETMLILPEVAQAFERCRILHVIRHPLDTCLRRTHMTSRTCNPIGNAVLTAAYRELGWSRDPAADPDHLRNAASWHYQVLHAQAFFANFPADRGMTLRYEALCDAPDETAATIARFIGVAPAPVRLSLDETRRRLWSPGDARVEEVWEVCGALAQAHGYALGDST